MSQAQIEIPEDNLDDDLRVMMRDSIVEDAEGNYFTNHDLLRQKLTMYVVDRDHKVWNHAYRLGEMQGQMRSTKIYKLSSRDSKRIKKHVENGQGMILKDPVEEEKI
jgi:hypothetical protein